MANRFLNSNSSNLNLSNGTVDIYALNLGASSLSSSMPVKTNSTRQLVSSKLAVSDTTGLQTSLDSKALKVGTEIIQAGGFKIAGGTNVQYLTADGGFGYPSGGSGSSNIYLYDSSTNTTMTPLSSQIRYNNSDQKLATQVSVSHLTRDLIDIDQFLGLVTQTTIIYIQEQGSSVNWIKYTVNGAITVIPNNYYVYTVVYQGSEGRGDTGFSNDQDITLSFFTNDINNNSRLNTLETKTQYLTSSSGNTTLTNDLTFSSSIVKGNVVVDNKYINLSGGNYIIGTKNGINNSVCLGFNAGTLSTSAQTNILIGQNSGQFLTSGNDNIGVGDGTIRFITGNENINIGTLSGVEATGDGNISIGHSAGSGFYTPYTGNDNIFIGRQTLSGNALLSNTIVIGSNQSATNSNEVLIGNASCTNLKMGNPSAFFTGKFRTSGGVSTEFLKANGTVDTNTYITSSALTPYLLKAGGTMVGDIDMATQRLLNCDTILVNLATTINHGYNNTINHASAYSTAIGSINTINNANQIIVGNYNTVDQLFSQAFGQGNILNSESGSIVGHGNWAYGGSFSNIFGFSNVITSNNCLAIGSGNEVSASYGMAIGSNINNSIANSCVIGDNAITQIIPNSLICNLGSSSAPFKDIYLSGKVVNTSVLSNSIGLSATLFYNGGSLSTSNSSFVPAGAMAIVGGVSVQIGQGTSNTRDKLFKTSLPTTSVGAYQDSGLLGGATFLLNSQALYVGIGWSIKFCFGIGDTNAVTNSTAGMCVGLVTTIPIVWGASLLPNTLASWIGIGHNPEEAKIAFYDKGLLGAGNKTLTSFNTTIPDTRWFHLTLVNQFNSNDVTMILTDSISGTSESRIATCGGGSSQLSTTTRLYPCIQRMMGGPSSFTGSAITQLGQISFTM